MKTKIAFWLMPSAEDRVFFQETLNFLAKEYDAPLFTPHVTIYTGQCSLTDSPAALIDQAIDGVHPLTLRVNKLDYSNEFTKTLFVQFYASESLSQISETLRCHCAKPSDYLLNPHLSLIYKPLSEKTQRKLVTELVFPQSEVVFDEIRAISTPPQVRSREDVEDWQVICQLQLG
ncbi:MULTISPECIES: cyclic phosphodiesterase-like protein [unclassified Coleofasciculus]|uniref:cyclic phosphodiesterase-like protein n=1 Tax=unclassified Coleofasciculus TaxID=2692782 RepID=UPI002AD540A6|nr:MULTISPECIES: cyclic phosphodiesterase-like protein [unclassified Coleofasciculus]